MKVNLKQNEIQTALRNYISGQGISLVGKSVEMEFTAGRKSSGLSVEIIIEDQSAIDIAELSAVVVSLDPAVVNTDTTVTATVSVVAVEGNEAQTKQEAQVQAPEAKEVEPAEEKTVVVTGNATSLFSS